MKKNTVKKLLLFFMVMVLCFTWPSYTYALSTQEKLDQAEKDRDETKQDIEDAGANGVAHGDAGITLPGSHDGGDQLGQGSADGHHGQTDDDIANTILLRQSGCTLYEPVCTLDECSTARYNQRNSDPKAAVGKPVI